MEVCAAVFTLVAFPHEHRRSVSFVFLLMLLISTRECVFPSDLLSFPLLAQPFPCPHSIRFLSSLQLHVDASHES